MVRASMPGSRMVVKGYKKGRDGARAEGLK
jgi:hypothetical protein